MDLYDFFDEVEDDNNLEGVGIGECLVAVAHKPTDALWEVGYEDITSNDWKDLRAVLYGERDPECLRHMTRVCGYYSQVGNWNESKKGELKDRQAGNYAI